MEYINRYVLNYKRNGDLKGFEGFNSKIWEHYARRGMFRPSVVIDEEVDTMVELKNWSLELYAEGWSREEILKFFHRVETPSNIPYESPFFKKKKEEIDKDARRVIIQVLRKAIV